MAGTKQTCQADLKIRRQNDMLFTQKTTYASILNATYTPLISNELGELKETLTKAKNGIIISMKNGWNKILPG